MSWRGFATVAAALLVPLTVSLTWRPEPPRITSSTGSVPKDARSWLGPAKGAIREIDWTAACRELLEAPEEPTSQLVPLAAADLDRVTRDVAARLAPLYHGRFERIVYTGESSRVFDDPAVRLRGTSLEDVRLGTGHASDYGLPELVTRVLPWEAFVAYASDPETRVYAVADPLDEAAEKVRARIDVVAPRVGCGVRPFWEGYAERTRAHVTVEGDVRRVEFDIVINSCERDGSRSFRLVRRGDVTFVVGGGRPRWTNGVEVDPDAVVVAALQKE